MKKNSISNLLLDFLWANWANWLMKSTLVECFIATMLCKGRSFVEFLQIKSGLWHVENNDNGTAHEPKLHVTEI